MTDSAYTAPTRQHELRTSRRSRRFRNTSVLKHLEHDVGIDYLAETFATQIHYTSVGFINEALAAEYQTSTQLMQVFLATPKSRHSRYNRQLCILYILSPRHKTYRYIFLHARMVRGIKLNSFFPIPVKTSQLSGDPISKSHVTQIIS